MRAVVQRVCRAKVIVDQIEVASISKGLLVFIGFHKEDTIKDQEYIAHKLTTMRIFQNSEKKMHFSLLDLNVEILLVSQFTLYGNTKGRRPDFMESIAYDQAAQMYENTVQMFSTLVGEKVKSGVFGADMQVELINDGPVTFLIDSRA